MRPKRLNLTQVRYMRFIKKKKRLIYDNSGTYNLFRKVGEGGKFIQFVDDPKKTKKQRPLLVKKKSVGWEEKSILNYSHNVHFQSPLLYIV